MANEVETLIFKAQTKELNQAKKDLRKLKEAANDAGDATDSLGGKQKGFGAALKANRGKIAAAVAGFTALAYAVNRGLKAVEEAGANFSILNARLVTATGSTAAAAAAFKDLNAFALQTPFTLDESVNGFAKLVNLGLEPTKASMTSFANTSAAMGKSLEQMIEAVADASTMEMERLKEFGIKSRKEGDKVTFAFRGIETTVEQSSAAVLAYLTEIGNTTFAGAAIEQTKTLKGSISNLDQAFGNLAIAAGEVSGANDIFAKSNNDLSDSLNDPEFQEGVANLTTALAKIKAGLVGIGTSALQGVVDFITTTQTEEASSLINELEAAENKLASFADVAGKEQNKFYQQTLDRIADAEKAIAAFNLDPNNRLSIQVAGLTSTDGFRDTETGTIEKPTETVAEGISEGGEKELTALEEKLNAERKLQEDFQKYLDDQKKTALQLKIEGYELEQSMELEHKEKMLSIEEDFEKAKTDLKEMAYKDGVALLGKGLKRMLGDSKAAAVAGVAIDAAMAGANIMVQGMAGAEGIRASAKLASLGMPPGMREAYIAAGETQAAASLASSKALAVKAMGVKFGMGALGAAIGGGGGGGGGSTGASAAAQTPVQEAANDEIIQAPQAINVTVDGSIDPEGARRIIEAINEATEDGLEINALVGS